MTNSDYTPPVQRLFTLGKPTSGEWADYRAGGLSAEHVPELIRLALDSSLFERYPASETPGWAPIHASRALGQLGAVEAVEPLMPLFEDLEPDDWQQQDLREVVALIGPAAAPPLLASLKDESRKPAARWSIGESLVALVRRHPEVRGEAVAALSRVLDHAERHEADFNAGLIGCLLDLKAVEAAEVIERAFQKGDVEEFLCGSWEHVRHELGLGPPPQRKVPAPPDARITPPPQANTPASPRRRAQERARARKKDKRKKRK